VSKLPNVEVAALSRRVVVEVQADVHRQLRRIAVLNDLKIYALTNALLEDALANEEHLKSVLKKLRT
jgi:hypothetical protein